MARSVQEVAQSQNQGGIDWEKFPGLCSEINAAKQELSDLGSHHAQIYKDAGERGHHRQALALALKLQRQEPEKRSEFLRMFDEYRNRLDLDAQQGLALVEGGDAAAQ